LQGKSFKSICGVDNAIVIVCQGLAPNSHSRRVDLRQIGRACPTSPSMK
jgi:hypothetical protein